MQSRLTRRGRIERKLGVEMRQRFVEVAGSGMQKGDGLGKV